MLLVEFLQDFTVIKILRQMGISNFSLKRENVTLSLHITKTVYDDFIQFFFFFTNGIARLIESLIVCHGQTVKQNEIFSPA